MALIIKVKEIIKTNKTLEKVVRLSLRPYFYLRYRKESLYAWMREKGLLSNTKVKYIRSIKNSHMGGRCFIVATGPSLTMEDLNFIKDEYSFGMNSSVLVLDKTEWTPDIFGIQDEYVYAKVERDLLEKSKSRLAGRILVSNTIRNLFPSSRQFHNFFLHYLDHKYNHEKTGEIRFSEDCSAVIYDDYSIIFSLMQLALYMGFKEIYLLGSDCNYNNEKAHFIDHGAKDPFAANAGSRLIYVHSKFKDFAEKHGVKVVNCTRGGMLEIYPRMQLEDVLGKRCI